MHSRPQLPRLRRRVVLAGAALVATLGLAAAALMVWWPTSTAAPAANTAPATDSTAAAETPTPAPLFSTDEEALAAARATYEGFLAATDAILADSGAGAERLDAFAEPDVVETELQGFQRFNSGGLRLMGQTTIENFALQSRSLANEVVVTAYACANVADVDVVDATGSSVVTDTRPDLTPFELTFSVSKDSPTGLAVASKFVWQGGGVC
ncbi:hypothetical protein B0I08_1022 [Glaciihabitans tibetensis]|uniref:Uncharacterized protein n=1 Tax=Glaciihabitans tibetensis TaxID=1266600 RepID=A0A2T0VGK1_9MICO|nr:hypothetical protein [Glaciihabitans tibetensis]PRY69330.1 hypothetical protein B0I08_1022 [Glaciihabitans tibetensis]